MKALFVYNASSGKGINKEKLNYIKEELSSTFDVFDIKGSQSAEDFKCLCKYACNHYDSLIIAGGDGSVNMMLNAIYREDKLPTLGIIPTGTVNDCAKNFGITSNYKKAVQIIKNQVVRKMDCCLCNDMVYSFVAAVGAYADVPYKTKKKPKELIGPFAYYFRAIPSFLKISKIKGEIIQKNDPNSVIKFSSPLILIMNGKYVGGFGINPKSKIDDGLVDIFIPRPGFFNSILRFIFGRVGVKHYQFSDFEINCNSKDSWDLDGEEGMKGNAYFSVKKEYFSIYGKPNK